MDSTAGADSGSGDDVGAADGLASQNETTNDPGANGSDPSQESAPAASTDYVNVPGFGRVHKDDAPKAREFVKGAYGAFEKANLTERQFKALQADPEAFLEQMGVDLDTIAGRRLARKLEEQLQTPEQLKQSEAEKAFADREAKLKEREESLGKKELEELTQREIQNIDRDFNQALKATGLPPTRANLREMARISRDYLAKGVDAPADHIAELVRDELGKHQDWRMQQVFDGPEEDFASWFNGLKPQHVEKIRQHLLSKVSSPTQPAQRSQKPSAPQPKQAAGPKRMTEGQWRTWMNT